MSLNDYPAEEKMTVNLIVVLGLLCRIKLTYPYNTQETDSFNTSLLYCFTYKRAHTHLGLQPTHRTKTEGTPIWT